MSTVICSHGLEVEGQQHLEQQTVGGGENLQVITRWEECDDFELIEDSDGAPLPGLLQRSGDVYYLLHEFINAYPQDAGPEVQRTILDSLAVRLAPFVKLEDDVDHTRCPRCGSRVRYESTYEGQGDGNPIRIIDRQWCDDCHWVLDRSRDSRPGEDL